MKQKSDSVSQFNERLLYHIWDAQHIVKNLVTISGKTVTVIFSGQWNTDSGPDFRNVVLNIDGIVTRGDIEIHLRTYDWTAHGHIEDTNYNNLILHVVYEHNGQYSQTITENGTQVEILELKTQLDQDVAKLIKKFSGQSVNSTDFCAFFAGMDSISTKLILSRLGEMRMRRKIARFSAELFFSDFNQILYQGIMESAGYSKNSYNMLQLALTYPFIDLQCWREEGLTLPELQMLFLGVGNLKEKLPKQISEALPYLSATSYPISLSEKIRGIDLHWHLFRIRPVNHPAVRLIQVSRFIYDNLRPGLLSSTLQLFSVANDKSALKVIISRLADSFSSPELPKSYRFGKERLSILLVNILLPAVILYGEKMGIPMIQKNAWYIYLNFPALPQNSIMKYIEEKYLNPSQIELIRSKAIFQQGVLKLYYDFCRGHNCELCSTHKRDIIMCM